MSTDKAEAKDAFSEIAAGKGTLTKAQVADCLMLLGHVAPPEMKKEFKDGTECASGHQTRDPAPGLRRNPCPTRLVGSFDTFFSIMQKLGAQPAASAGAVLESVWKTFDPEDHGSIRADRLIKLLSSLGDPLPKDEVEKLVKASDADSDGYIDKREMLYLLQEAY